MCEHMDVCAYVCAYTYLGTDTLTHKCIYIHLVVYTGASIYTCMYTYVYIYLYIYVYVYIYIYIVET